jgi:hypothetical protein
MGGLAVPAQLRCQLTDVDAELADLFRRLGEIVRVDLHLWPPWPGLGVASQGDATGYASGRSATGKERCLCLAGGSPDAACDITNRVSGLLCGLLDCAACSIDAGGPVF